MPALDLSSLKSALAALDRGLKRAAMVNLSPQQQQLVRNVLRRRFPDHQARVVGSRANGPSKPWSDLDLVIFGSQPVNDLALAEARADFEESDLPFRVDLTLWRDLPGTIQQSIESRGIPV